MLAVTLSLLVASQVLLPLMSQAPVANAAPTQWKWSFNTAEDFCNPLSSGASIVGIATNVCALYDSSTEGGDAAFVGVNDTTFVASKPKIGDVWLTDKVAQGLYCGAYALTYPSDL